MSASELAQRYRDLSLSPVEVVQALIARAENINPKLNAFTYTFYDEALDRAKISEQKSALDCAANDALRLGSKTVLGSKSVR